MPDALFPINDDELLISVYLKQGRTLDDLPYTEEFEKLYADMYGPDGRDSDQSTPKTKAQVIHRLQNLRKAGKLPKLGRAKSSPPKIDAEQEQQLVTLVESEISQLSKRDQLLYQPTFDRVVDSFNADTGLSLSPHDIWRIVAKLAK
ncbi:MAG: DUF4148 domain-containing protein [Planctomycetota bacterium]